MNKSSTYWHKITTVADRHVMCLFADCYSFVVYVVSQRTNHADIAGLFIMLGRQYPVETLIVSFFFLSVSCCLYYLNDFIDDMNDNRMNIFAFDFSCVMIFFFYKAVYSPARGANIAARPRFFRIYVTH